jgi:two-component system, chemotaxis family, protein-glutamate methylesterase/glutaminase
MGELLGKPGLGGEYASFDEPYRVMIVDDSAIIRGLLTRALESDPMVRVTASVGDGQMALNQLKRQNVDVIILDIEMPIMDGLTALPQIVKAAPHSRVIMASTLTKKNAEVSLRALSMGAADYVPKPSSTRELGAADAFKRELLEKVKIFAAQARQLQGKSPPQPRSYTATTQQQGRLVTSVRQPFQSQATAAPSALNQIYTARRVPNSPPPPPRARTNLYTGRPEVIAIGSSTGGPQALFDVLGALGPGVMQPILITQHMPPTFTTILAEHITRQCKLPCAEGKEGEALVGGRVYLAPGDWHMQVVVRAGVPVIHLTQEPPENFCRPAVDPMLRSLVQTFGGRILAVILTGMGQDGTRGCELVHQAGGTVLAQDEASSVVWGMPGSVVHAGLADLVLPIKEIGAAMRKHALRSAA